MRIVAFVVAVALAGFALSSGGVRLAAQSFAIVETWKAFGGSPDGVVTTYKNVQTGTCLAVISASGSPRAAVQVSPADCRGQNIETLALVR